MAPPATVTLRRFPPDHRPSSPHATEWRGFHLFYHGDRDRLLTDLVGPCTAGLLRDGLIHRFFWIRYNLGGPHVRLRLELDAEHAPTAAARVRAAAADFFRLVPSTEPLAEEVVHRHNQGIIPTDPFATQADDVIFADNSVAECPMHLEVNRYGGPDLCPHSVSLFALSSAVALRFIASSRHLSPGERLTQVFRLLVRQAWGHADGEAEFSRLLGYALGAGTDRVSRYAAAADAVFSRQREGLCALLRTELAALAAGEAPADLVRGAQDLAHALARAGPAAREAIAISHLHMTANRLGLLNREEVYVSRLLVRTAEVLAATDDGFWSGVWSLHRHRNGAPPHEPVG